MKKLLIETSAKVILNEVKNPEGSSIFKCGTRFFTSFRMTNHKFLFIFQMFLIIFTFLFFLSCSEDNPINTNSNEFSIPLENGNSWTYRIYKAQDSASIGKIITAKFTTELNMKWVFNKKDTSNFDTYLIDINLPDNTVQNVGLAVGENGYYYGTRLKDSYNQPLDLFNPEFFIPKFMSDTCIVTQSMDGDTLRTTDSVCWRRTEVYTKYWNFKNAWLREQFHLYLDEDLNYKLGLISSYYFVDKIGIVKTESLELIGYQWKN